MKLISTLFFTFCFGTLLLAQLNDDCADLVDMGTVPICTDDVYTNVNATASNIGFGNSPSCFNGGTAQNDVWFSFTTTTDLTDLSIQLQGVLTGPNADAITNPQIALYRGACQVDGLSEIACLSSPDGSIFIQLDVLGLTPNTTYFVRVNDYSATAAPNWGDFTLCVVEYIPAINIGDVPSTTACTGTLYDSGGPDEDYGNNENATFTICPNDPHSCINIDLAMFNLDPGDFINFYEGIDVNGALVASVTGFSNGNDFPIVVSDDCVTVEFTSDGFTVQEGFELTWQCSPLDCGGSSIDNPSIIGNIPYQATNVSTCDGMATFAESPCSQGGFLGGPEYVFQYDAPGGFCAEIQISDAEANTGVLVLNGPPGDPGTVCVAQGPAGFIGAANFQTAGTYYIVVANQAGCTDFDITIQEADCALSPALVDALCNPLNGCIEEGGVPSIFNFENGFQDVPFDTDVNGGCWLGVGAQADFFWFTIQAQADGPFGFVLESADNPSDIDVNVWGPFTQEEVCETPANVIDFVSNNQPIRSTWAAGADPTGLADIHPVLGTPVTDEYDCGNFPGAGGDDFVSAIQAQEGEVYIVLFNDFGNVIGDAGVSVDWSPSQPDVLAPGSIEVVGTDTAVCAGQSVQLELITPIETVTWLDPSGTLSCTGCLDPVATPSETTVYQAVVDAVCYTDTVDVLVEVFFADAGPDQTVCLQEEFVLSAGSDFDFADYVWDVPAGLTFSCTDCPNPTVTASTPGTYDIEVSVISALCTLTDVLTITVETSPAPDYIIEEDFSICEGETATLGGTATPGASYNWTSEPDGFTSMEANPAVSPLETTTYYLTVSSGACLVGTQDSVTVSVGAVPVINTVSDTLVCQSDSLVLGATTIQDGVTYSWTGPSIIADPSDPNTTAFPQSSGTYTLTADDNGCIATSDVEVSVVPIGISLLQEDSLEICLGTEVTLQADVAPMNALATWTPDNGSLNSTTGNEVIATPTETTTYIGMVENQGCVRLDTVYIRVDSLPMMEITADPEKEFYCEGDIITLISPLFEPSFFPDIDFMWLEGPGYETGDSLWNMVLTAQDTFTYQRVVTNNACADTAEIEIFVVTSEEIFITPADTTICPGESVQLNLTYAGQGDISWEPESDLSCTDCFDPIANPTSTVTYTAKAEKEDCVQEASATIIVINPPDPSLSGNVEICAGDATTLSVVNPQGGVTYTWTSPDDPGLNEDGTQITVQPASNTTYTLTAVNDCATVTEDLLVTVVEPADFSVEGVTICLGDPAVLTAVGTAPDGVTEVIRWFLPNDVVRFGETITINDLTETTDILVTYTYGDDCETIEQMITVEVLQIDFSILLTSTPDLDSTMIFQGDEVAFNATILPDSISSGGFTYIWEVNGVVQEGEVLSMFTSNFTELGDNTVTVTAITPEGCTDSQSITFEVKEPMFDIPNVFTPNGDEINDVFRVYNSGSIEIESFRVYNRWGNLVYEGSGEDAAWDGTYKDTPAPSEVYIYQILFRLGNASFEETGDVTLMR